MAGIEPTLAPWHGAVLPLHHIHMEPSARFELAAFPVPGGRSTAGATKARLSLGNQDSDLDSEGQNLGGCQLPHSPSEAPAGIEPAAGAVQRPRSSGWATGAAGGLCGTLPRNIRHLGPTSLPPWSTSTWSRYPVPTRAFCLTGARVTSPVRRRGWGIRGRTWTERSRARRAAG